MSEKQPRITNRDVYDRLCQIESEMAHRRDLMPPHKVAEMSADLAILSKNMAAVMEETREIKQHINDWKIARAVLKWLAWLGGSVAVLLAGAWVRSLWGGK